MSSSAEPAWLAEPAIAGYQQRAEVTALVHRETSPYQHLEIYDTVPFGRTLVLEGAVQTTLRDEFIYHEMLVHPAMLAHGAAKRVLIIGGGDGGTLRRVLEHPVQRAIMVEIDGAVVEACARYMPEIAADAFADPRAKLLIADGTKFLAKTDERFDVVLVDSTDPVGPAQALFGVEFYRQVARVLNPEGILVTQSGSPLLMQAELRLALVNISAVFSFAQPCLANIPSYPGCLWSFLAASKDPKAREFLSETPTGRSRASISRRFERAALRTRYYTPELHFASFALPTFIRDAVAEGVAV